MEGELKQSIEIGLLVVVPQGAVNIEHDWQTISVELPIRDNYDQVALSIGTYVLESLRTRKLLPVELPKVGEK